jgi:hypothetical protein
LTMRARHRSEADGLSGDTSLDVMAPNPVDLCVRHLRFRFRHDSAARG